MDEQIYIPVPSNPKADLAAYFQRLINEYVEGDGDGHELGRALDLTANYYDPRIELTGVTVTDVSVNSTGVCIYYDVDFFAYNGCKDVDGSHTCDGREAVGTLDGDVWVFDAYVAPERLSPSEEL